MSEQTNFNYEEASHAVEETKTALERAQACVSRLHQVLTENPAAFAPLAEPAFRLRDRLIEDLGTLEARLAQTGPAGHARDKQFDLGQQARTAEERGVSQADVRALGGQ
ncbi:MAG TPA: hypothetical protein VIJ94_06590 [Caulobacteraceae bacterium]